MQNKEIDQEKSVNEKNLEVFNRYFPGCLSIENDNQLTLDVGRLKALLGDFSEIKEEGYGLDFVGKKIALNQAFKKNHKILKPLNESISKHILIKGDNLDALKILKQSYSEKIKMIYIDPPYNTKSENFIYGDDFSQSNEEVLKTLDYSKEKLDYIKNLFGLKSHSGWLSFMYPRLLLARDLLKQDGVIFISIDDNEAAQLKLLCDEIFGEGNFVTCAVWHKKDNASFLGKDIIDLLEYVLIYKKSASFKGTRDCLIDIEKHRELITKSSKIGERIFKKDCCLIENGDFTGLLEKGLYGSKQFCMEILEDVEIICGIPKNDIKIKGRFCWTQSSLDNETLKGGRIEIKSIKGMKPIFYKNFDNNIPFRPMRNLLSKKIENDVATYNDAANEIKEIFDNLPLFEYSKPSKLIKKFIKNVTDINSGDIILDFFAGSGTTAHAVLESNKSDYQKLSEGGGGYLMA
ncbi:site-specific DNA-methyltransferase [Helicobacter pylori]|nr:site-specific DNA-methyltransferase [Helicobacter pylori]